jgi:hypothetical protein
VGTTAPPPALVNGKQEPSAVGTVASSAATKPGPVVTKPADAALDAHTITGFKKSTVILYSSATGADGQKVPTSNMPLPLPVRAQAAGGARLEIMTLDGPRWIARNDVILAAATPR